MWRTRCLLIGWSFRCAAFGVEDHIGSGYDSCACHHVVPPYMVPVSAPTHPAVSNAVHGSDPLGDGDYVGYLRSIELDPHTVVFDPAQWLSGPAGVQAAVEDGYIKVGESLPNDYYLRPAVRDVRTVALASQVIVTVARCPASCGTSAGTLDGLAAALAHGDPATDLGAPYRSAGTYWVKIVNGQVVRIDEQSRP